jgi:tetratricopeptide (TPR) repeat protein
VLNIACDAAFAVWLNGREVGRGEFRTPTRFTFTTLGAPTRRVYSFDVAGALRPGANVLAVECTGSPRGGGLLAELTCTGEGAAPVTLASDATWKVSAEVTDGWRDSGFADAGWPTAQEVAPYGQGDPSWQGLVWDALVPQKARTQSAWLSPEPSGNVCDTASREGFPLLRALVASFDLPADPNDGGHFLRYDRDNVLAEIGLPGVAPLEGKLPQEPLERGRAFAARREWSRAAACYAQVPDQDRQKEESHFWFEYAALLVLSDDVQGYREACAHMLKRCTEPNPVRPYLAARACTLAPESVHDPAQPKELAQSELTGNAGATWSLTEQAALAFRERQREQAVPLLERSLQTNLKPGEAVLDWLWLSLCYQRLGKAQEAQTWLGKAAKYLDKHPDGWTKDAEKSEDLHLHNWLEANVLRREASGESRQ